MNVADLGDDESMQLRRQPRDGYIDIPDYGAAARIDESDESQEQGDDRHGCCTPDMQLVKQSFLPRQPDACGRCRKQDHFAQQREDKKRRKEAHRQEPRARQVIREWAVLVAACELPKRHGCRRETQQQNGWNHGASAKWELWNETPSDQQMDYDDERERPNHEGPLFQAVSVFRLARVSR